MSDIVFTIEKEDPEEDIFKINIPIPEEGMDISKQLETILSIITEKKCKIKMSQDGLDLKFEIRKEK